MGIDVNGRDKWLHLTDTVACNYLSLPLIYTSDAQILNCSCMKYIDQGYHAKRALSAMRKHGG